VIYNDDCFDVLATLDDKSIDLVVLDPPYNIGKEEWDVIDDYPTFLERMLKESTRVLKDSGSVFVFHNEFPTLCLINSLTELEFRQLLVWSKRFEGSSRKGYLDGFVAVEGLNNFQLLAEYVLFYTKPNLHLKIREERERRGIKQSTIAKEVPSKTGGLTGWFSNIELGKNLPTEDTIKPITKHLGLTMDDLSPKFRNQKTHHSVFDYDFETKQGHITPKPVALIEMLIKHTTDEGDVVLDPFMGSGTTGVACKNLNRKFIGVEKEEEYFALAGERLAS
jgi:site-specific DNA-methyltransferase (adenine-specific)